MPSDTTFQGSYLVSFFLNPNLPMVKGYNRLEARPRIENFDRSLRAEIRDPLWMLSRQYQMGEFQAEDAGSPIMAKVQISTTDLNRFQALNQPEQSYSDAVPLEMQVETEPPPMTLALRLQIACHFLKLAAAAGLSRDYRSDLLNHTGLRISLPEKNKENHRVYAHQQVWQLYAAAAGRSLDGGKLLSDLAAGEDPFVGLAFETPEDEEILRDCLIKTGAWFERTYGVSLSAAVTAWDPARLEYRFQCAAPAYSGHGKYNLTAREYFQGHLDWYNFDLNLHRIGDTAPGDKHTFEFIPTHIQFSGMPNLRWWEFENRKTSFGNIDAHTTDLAKLMLMEFGLIYANDWFIVPFEIPVGKLARVEGLVVKNVFGERFWIPAASETSGDWDAWSMYRLSNPSTLRANDRSLLLPPAVDRLLEGQDIEKVHLIRDEMANMVWGIESTLFMEDGRPQAGAEISSQRSRYLALILPPVHDPGSESMETTANIKYSLMTGVPEHWIPFIPVRMPDEADTNREIQLQRAVMMRQVRDDVTEEPVHPGSAILRQNLPGPYFIHEEEVPRAGIIISRSFQRARWHDGHVYLWLGRRKRTGRGEGSSGLRFDQLINLPRPSETTSTV